MRDMVRMEHAVETRREHVHIAATLLGPNVDLKKFRSVNDDFNKDIDVTSSLREYALFYAQEKELRRNRTVEAMMKAFERMKKDGTIAAFEESVQKSLEKIHARDAEQQSSFAAAKPINNA